MKILFVSQSSYMYGSEKGLLKLVEGYQESGIDPIVVCPSTGPLWDELGLLGVKREAFEFGGYGWLKRPDWQIFFLMKFLKLLRRVNPEAVVINYEGNVPLLVLACKLLRLPVVRMLKREVRPQGSMGIGFHMHLFDRLSFKLCDGVICISGAVEIQLRAALGDASKVPPMWTLYDPQSITPISDGAVEARKESLGISKDELVVGVFVRIHPVKGIDNIIHASALILDQVPQARFMIVGDNDGSDAAGQYRNYLMDLAQELGIADKFIWTGFVTDPLTVMAVCDLTCLPSRAEGLGRVLIESWSVGRAVIASDIDGPGEVMRLSGGGLLHPVDDVETLAKYVVKLLNDPDEREQLADKGRLWVEKTCSPEEYRRNFLTIMSIVRKKI